MSDTGWGVEPWGEFPWGGVEPTPFPYPTPPTLIAGASPDLGHGPDPTADDEIPDWFPV